MQDQKESAQQPLKSDIVTHDHVAQATEKSLSQSDSDIVGTDLASFALRKGLDADEVWQKIRVGELLARSEMGKIYVYEKASKIARVIEDQDILDPREEGYQESSQALLSPDLLKQLARDLHKEKQQMLALTQQTILKMNAISQQLIESKNLLLTEKDQRINDLLSRLESMGQENEVLQTRIQSNIDEVENLKMLLSILESKG